MNTKHLTLTLASFLMFFSSKAIAQTTHGDMWTLQAEKSGLFSPHPNFCDSSEVYATINGGPLGYCIEKTKVSRRLGRRKK